MSHTLKVLDEAGPDGSLPAGDREMIMPVINSLAVALFSLQTHGMIRFPVGLLTMGEIAEGLDFTAASFIQKLIESKPKAE